MINERTDKYYFGRVILNQTYQKYELILDYTLRSIIENQVTRGYCKLPPSPYIEGDEGNDMQKTNKR